MITLKINVGVVYNDFKDFDEVKAYLEKDYNVYLVELRRNNLAVAFVY